MYYINKLILILLVCLASFVHAGNIKFKIVPKSADGKIVDVSWARVYLEADEVDFVACDKTNGILIELDFDKNYIIKVQSTHYETLEIKFNTHVTQADKGYIYENSFSYDMIESKHGMDVKYIDAPKIEYKFDNKKLKFINSNVYAPKYDYVPKKPEETKPEIPKEALGIKDEIVEEKQNKTQPVDKKIPQEPENKNQEHEEKPVAIKEKEDVPVINDNISNLFERDKSSKLTRSEMYEELQKDQEVLMNDRAIKAYNKRQFLEEVSDSRIEIKKAQRNYQE